MDQKILWPVAIKNSICVICWTALAIIFNKWWIALFCLLCMSKVKAIHKTYRICDKCGKHSPYAEDYNSAIEKAKESGWIYIADGNKDYCPECRKEIGI